MTPLQLLTPGSSHSPVADTVFLHAHTDKTVTHQPLESFARRNMIIVFAFCTSIQVYLFQSIFFETDSADFECYFFLFNIYIYSYLFHFFYLILFLKLMDNRNRSSKDNHSWKKMTAILWSQNHCTFLFQIKCEINIYLYINRSLCFIHLLALITHSLCLDYYFKKTIHCVQIIFFFLWTKWSWRHDFYLHVIK